MRLKANLSTTVFYIVLLVACGLQHAAAQEASQSVSVGAAWIQCGGINGCPPGLVCYDMPWQGFSCPGSYHCLRLDQYYWQCTPNSLWRLRQPAPVAAAFGQCGGTDNCVSADQCGDRQWASCPSGFQCVRFDSFFAQCRPGEADSSSSTPSQLPAAVAVAPAQPVTADQHQQAAAEKPPTPAAVSEEAAPRSSVPSTSEAPNPTGAPASEPAAAALAKSTAAKATGADSKESLSQDSAANPPVKREQLQQTSPAPAAPAAAAARPVTRGEAAPRQAGTAAVVNTTALNSTAPRSATTSADQPARTPVKLDLRYHGIAVDEFQEKYAQGSLAAVSEISGITEDNITSTLRSAAVDSVSSSSAGNRRLLQEQAGVVAGYQIDAARPEQVLQRINAATANNGEQFFAALEANGVPIRPSISVNGNLAVIAAPVASSSSGSSTAMPQWQQIVIGVVVGVGGLLLLLLVAFCCRRCMKHKADKQRKHEADLVAAADADDTYDAAAGNVSDQGRRAVYKDAAKMKSGSPDTAPQYRSDQQQSPFAAMQGSDDPQLTMVVNAAAPKTRPTTLTPSSTFESAAAAGAAAAALIDKSPRLRDTSPVMLESPDDSPMKHEVEAATAAAAVAAVPARRPTAAILPPWDSNTDTRDTAAVQEAKNKRTAAAAVEPWRPSKPSEAWKPTAHWKPPGRAEIPPLPVPAFGSVPLKPVAQTRAAGSSAAAAVDGQSALGSAVPRPAAAAAAGTNAAAVAGISRDVSADSNPATPRASSMVAGEDDDDGYDSGLEDGFATPKSSASFVSARSAGGSESSYRSVRSNAPSEGAASAASYQTAATDHSFHSATTGQSMFSAASRATNSSSMSAVTAASAATSAREWPRAYVPPVGVEITDSGSEGMPSPSVPLQPSNQSR